MVRAAFSDRATAPLLFQNKPQAECDTGYSKTGVAASAGAAGRKNVRRCAGYLRFYAAFAPCRSLGRDFQLQCGAECSRCSAGILCDAAAYDQGVVRPDSLAEAVHVQGRGGTQLQPGIDLLEHAEDFPKDAPILLITDGQCEHLHLHGRTHAYLLPKGRSLPFAAKGEVFWLDESSLTRMIYVPNKSAIS